MKVLILNNSGNVGKSFLSRELFFSNFENENKAIVEFETHNSSSVKFENLEKYIQQTQDIDDMLKAIFKLDDVVIDIGASNIIDFLNSIKKLDIEDLSEEIDFVIVPVVANLKQQEDSLKTLTALKQIGLIEKTRIIFNNFKVFADFDKFIEKAKKIVKIDKNLAIPEFDVIKNLDSLCLLTRNILNDGQDYKALAKEAYKADDDEKGDLFTKLYKIKKMSKTLNEHLKKIYEKIKG